LAWEQATNKFETLGIRTSILRTGLVLNKEGGALSKILIPVKKGFGNGRQYLPWIHIDNLCVLYIKAIEDYQMKGVFNAVTPDFQTNKSFTHTLAKTLNKPYCFPNIPAFLLKLVLGEMSVLLLEESQVSSRKLISVGYKFKYSKLDSALKNLLK
jgi:hypothetical protein